MNYSFHPQAQVEFEQAIEYYEGCQDGLGYDFAIEIHDTIITASTFPVPGQSCNLVFVVALQGASLMASSISWNRVIFSYLR